MRIISLLLFFIISVHRLQAAVYFVDNVNDSGPGSFRQAILEANSFPDQDFILFTVPSVSNIRISLMTQLPDIIGPVYINGMEQGGIGYSGPPPVEIDGNGLTLNEAGIRILASQCTVTGLSIGGFDTGIHIQGDNNYIFGNYIGLFRDGSVNPNTIGINLNAANNNIIGSDLNGKGDSREMNIISGNATGIRLNQSTLNSINSNLIGTDITGTLAIPNTENGIELISNSNTNSIGRNSPFARNVISGNGSNGISINASNGNSVIGNLIGTDITGNAGIPNIISGIELVDSDNTVIGGALISERNIISKNQLHGILLKGNSNQNEVYNNYIGLGSDGTTALGNGSDGIRIAEGAGRNFIGFSGDRANVIAHNSGNGINVTTDGGSGNGFLGNSIYNNALLGIDLNNDGVTANELKDIDTGPNKLQNFPVLESVIINPSDVNINGTMFGEPLTFYELEFFSNSIPDPSGYGEGSEYIGTTVVTTDADGKAEFNLVLFESVPSSSFISSTATGPDFSTSEFSGPYDGTLPVTLLSFELQAKEGIAILQWKVALERNVKHYAIYSSENGIDFDSIGHVPSNGNQSYQYSDYINYKERLYYKFKTTDYDGSYSFSPVKYLGGHDQVKSSFIHPNPCSSNFIINLSGYDQDEISIKVVGVDGKIVFDESYVNMYTISIPTNSYASGLYYVLIYSEKDFESIPLNVVK
ncbi:T9SS type A sorting domain-containing protein [Sporocytophaga myxococcoides]|uniref:T9SS type A sorting domain-containing protein n=1 Tax=Sporocytophaga myxococcoides TaxID=153721 RepID=UPI00048D5B68|nr:T9SS type A sorting domain-containing protein [Sporocytophaga myxococcoides]